MDSNEEKLKKMKDEIVRNKNEMNEVIAYLDYSFERAYTVKEREYIMAYQVSPMTC